MDYCVLFDVYDVFFFKQKTAYEMRISDWSSDVCSSDLIVLLSGEGRGTSAIMTETGKSKTCVWRWQERFMHEGVDGLLRDRPRPPGKTPVPPARVAEIVRLTQEAPPHEATHWTLRAMAKVAGIAASTVQSIWKAHGLTPHRWRHFKLSDRKSTRLNSSH